MFDSGISIDNLVSELKQEVDIALPISNKSFVLWLNSLVHFLYTEFIQEQNKIIVDGTDDCIINLGEILMPDDEAAIRFEDIYTVFADTKQLIKSTVTSGNIFPNTFYKMDNNLAYNALFQPKEIRIIYFVKPKLKAVDENDNIEPGNVMLPIEFIDLVKAKLRGEAYKLSNEDSLAAKWLNDYNILLETFKAWLNSKQPNFGM